MEQEKLHPALESEMQGLSEKIKQRLESVPTNEAVRSGLEERVAEILPAKPERKEESVLPDYAGNISPEERFYVEKIVDNFWHDGDLLKAASAAASGGPRALDLFHDILSGKMHDAMKAKGLL